MGVSRVAVESRVAATFLGRITSVWSQGLQLLCTVARREETGLLVGGDTAVSACRSRRGQASSVVLSTTRGSWPHRCTVCRSLTLYGISVLVHLRVLLLDLGLNIYVRKPTSLKVSVYISATLSRRSEERLIASKNLFGEPVAIRGLRILRRANRA